ncbi:MAG TPA: hypothetical protein EYN06_09810, partial [Myxococcales bacterium]|nr:hypothetical protein [Myxococcales bacterium]
MNQSPTSLTSTSCLTTISCMNLLQTHCILSCLFLCSLFACDDSNTDSPPESTQDIPPMDSVQPPNRPKVEIDISEWNDKAAGAFVRQITDKADLMSGSTAQGKIGDWIIGNDKAHFIVQGHDRHSGPCPWGGNVIDVALLNEEGKAHDVTGEICTFIQLGRTLLPEHFEIIVDGSKGPAILAVIGKDTVLDFLNIGSLVNSFLGTNIELPVDSNLDLPITMTTYFLLDGQSNALRVISAFRNDDDTDVAVHLLVGDILDSGGVVEFFNPASSKQGFGYAGYNPEAMNFLAFRGQKASYAYVPDPQANGTHGASYLAISGVAGIGLGIDNLLTALTQPREQLLENPALIALQPGESGQVGRWIVAGNGSLSSITETIYRLRGKQLTEVEVKLVTEGSGEAIPGHRVSLVQDGAAVSQGVTDENGRFAIKLPQGSYTVVADNTERRAQTSPTIEVAEQSKSVQLSMEPQSIIQMKIINAIGEPTPAKVAVRCIDECPGRGNSTMRDVSTDGLPGGLQAISFVGVDGIQDILVPSGKYALVVSRGPAWSVWPNNDLAGQEITIEAGQSVPIEAIINKVLPVNGWVSGDLHVHAVNSPDSPIGNERRVRSMMAEGVDVLVSTDHDYITDFAPTIKSLGAQSQLMSVIGEELTTFDYGHFNSFPLDHQADDDNGGALDWGDGENDNLHPAKIFAGLHANSGDQVIQVNHAIGGYFGLTGLNAQNGTTSADPAGFRISTEGHPSTKDDTGLFDDGWTAMEMLNGLKGDRFYNLAAYWFTFLSRGMQRTGTAVSDTHKSLSSQSGGSRSWVWVGEGLDHPDEFDPYHFAKQINAGHLVGSNGPMVEFSATTSSSSDVHMTGDTMVLNAPGIVSFAARVLVPQWMRVNRVELVGNVSGVAPVDGEHTPVNVKPLLSEEFELGPEDLVNDQYYERVVNLSLDVSEDGWYIVLVHGQGESIPSMTPVTPKDVAPFAFTNPIYVDVGGDGWKPTFSRENQPADAESTLFEAET